MQVIWVLAERLDAHRRARLEAHSALTVTGLYNVMSRLRGSEALDPAEALIHDQGLVSVLRELHDGLDAAVLAAYGCEGASSSEDLLSKLAALNAVRVQEEKGGLVRYLRPAYQDPKSQVQVGLDLQVEQSVLTSAPLAFPERLGERAQAVRQLLRAAKRLLSATQIARSFRNVRTARVETLLELLVDLGQAQPLPEAGRFEA